MNLTQCILKQLGHFPTVTRSQLKRLVSSYNNGHLNVVNFNIELNHLVRKGLVKEIKCPNFEKEQEYSL